MKKVLFYLVTIAGAILGLKLLLDRIKEQNVSEEDVPLVKSGRDYIELD